MLTSRLIMPFFGLLLLPFTSFGADVPDPIYPKQNGNVELLTATRIWSKAIHNAFPDIERFKDRWYVAVREGTAHGISGHGQVRIISSKDGMEWESVAMFEDFGDYRRAELSVTADNRLMVLSKVNLYGKANADEKNYEAKDHQGKSHKVITEGVQNRVAFSEDGKKWTKMQPVRGTDTGAWFYSGVQWHKGFGYAIDRQGRQLYRTRNGIDFEKVSPVPVGNESRISFLPNGTMIVFWRNGSLATSPPPHKKWTLNEKNKKGPHSYGGPGIIALPDGEVWTASRHRIDPEKFAYPKDKKAFPDGTLLFHLEKDVLVPKLLIRGGGDRGYNGLIWHENNLWMVYNAPSSELRKSCIYFVKIKLK